MEASTPAGLGMFNQRAFCILLFASAIAATCSRHILRQVVIHATMARENLALRQQLANLRRTSGRPRPRRSDRAFWLALFRLWSCWADVRVIVKPDTVVRWHRTGFRLFWRWKSRLRTSSQNDGTGRNQGVRLAGLRCHKGEDTPRPVILLASRRRSHPPSQQFRPCPVRTQQSGGRSPLCCCAGNATKCKNNYDSKQQSPPTSAIARRIAVLNGARAAGCMIGRSGRGSRSAA